MSTTTSGLSEKQQAIRATGLGASEVPIALGLSRFTSAAELAAVKRGELPPFSGNEFTHWGQRLERVIADEWLDRHREEGVSIFTPGTLRHPTCSVLLASPDRVIAPEGRRARETWRGLLEIKATSAYRASEFGDAADEIPEAFLVQTQVQMEVCGLEHAALVPLIGGNDYREYPQIRDPEMGGQLVQFVERWWADHVVQGLPVPVDGSEASTSYLRRRYPTNQGPALRFSEEAELLAARLRAAKAALRAAEAEESAAGNGLRAFIGDAAGIEGVATWRANRPWQKIDWEALAREAIEPLSLDRLIARHTTTKPGSRVLRLLTAKE